jgi:tetratricopeptide (TPR) repeat protein
MVLAGADPRFVTFGWGTIGDTMGKRGLGTVTFVRHPAMVLFCLAAGSLMAQTTKKGDSVTPAESAQRALALVEQGRCQEALPIFQRTLSHITEKHLLYSAAMGQSRCAMAKEDAPAALSALMLLKREFPDDPEVLFISVHYFSHLAMRTSQELAAKAPTSFQARRLEAEAYESQGKWDEAAGIYRGILQQNPKEHGLHYRIGQVLVSKAGDSGPVDDARAEFQKELEIDPRNSAAEFVLGELDRRAGNWDQAASHFARASQVDAEFAEAYLALGMSLNSAAKFSEAITPLEKYVKMLPSDPLGHYQLGVAYGRTGNREGAMREMALQKETAAKQQLPPANGSAGRVVR